MKHLNKTLPSYINYIEIEMSARQISKGQLTMTQG